MAQTPALTPWHRHTLYPPASDKFWSLIEWFKLALSLAKQCTLTWLIPLHVSGLYRLINVFLISTSSTWFTTIHLGSPSPFLAVPMGMQCSFSLFAEYHQGAHAVTIRSLSILDLQNQHSIFWGKFSNSIHVSQSRGTSDWILQWTGSNGSEHRIITLGIVSHQEL